MKVHGWNTSLDILMILNQDSIPHVDYPSHSQDLTHHGLKMFHKSNHDPNANFVTMQPQELSFRSTGYLRTSDLISHLEGNSLQLMKNEKGANRAIEMFKAVPLFSPLCHRSKISSDILYSSLKYLTFDPPKLNSQSRQ